MHMPYWSEQESNIVRMAFLFVYLPNYTVHFVYLLLGDTLNSQNSTKINMMREFTQLSFFALSN
jgi:hypothetical protein